MYRFALSVVVAGALVSGLPAQFRPSPAVPPRQAPPRPTGPAQAGPVVLPSSTTFNSMEPTIYDPYGNTRRAAWQISTLGRAYWDVPPWMTGYQHPVWYGPGTPPAPWFPGSERNPGPAPQPVRAVQPPAVSPGLPAPVRPTPQFPTPMGTRRPIR